MKRMLFIVLSLVMLLGGLKLSAQRNCGSMDVLQNQIEQNPQRLEQLQNIEKFTQNWIQKNQESKAAIVVTIPVVVHVVYRTASENISTAQVQSQISVLNDDFRRLNNDANNKWSQAADTEIDFCLATLDPSGNATSGITRTSTSVSAHGTNDSVKSNASGGKDAWPAGEYLNIWVCNIGQNILGYAQFPGGAASTDGVVIDYRYYGTNGAATFPFDLGRTGTHEVGHWLNLRHIWGDGNCNVDDFVSDTPGSDAPNYGCASNHASCSSLDMVENYMDYSDDACMNLFTGGQKNRMQALFSPGGSRYSLVNSNGCGGGNPPPPCQDNEISITINLDNYPSETTWDLKTSGSIVAAGGPYNGQAQGSTVVIELCEPNACYDFTIYDSYGDGICCGYGSGSYNVVSSGTTYASGGAFTSSETTNFCLGGQTPTCNDGIQNQGETGVDCGGPCAPCASCNDGIQNQGETGVDCGGPCAPCASCNDGIQNQGETGVDCGGPCAACNSGNSTTLSAHFFETGWDNWQDGGSDCYRYSGSRSYEGSYSIRIRDNSGTRSSMTSETYDLSSYSQVEVEFYFYAYSMETGEDFWVRYHDGASWITVATYARGTSFNNNGYYVATVTLSNGTYNFPTNAKFRFQCDASANGDQIYIDAVTITGIGSGARVAGEAIRDIQLLEQMDDQGEVDDISVSVYPNPASGIVNFESEDLINSIQVYSITGEKIDTPLNVNDPGHLDVSDFKSGLYFIRFEIEEEIITRKLIVK